jgi:putative endonuclease
MAETLCALRLRLAGWRVVARDFRTEVGEIDIAARRGRVLAVIEVKARPDVGTAGAALTRRQQRRIINAALRLMQTRPDLAGLDLRFDAMLVRPWRWPVHLADAWRPEA